EAHKFGRLLTGEVAVEVEWVLHERYRWESGLMLTTPDVDNIVKPLLDALCGPDALLIGAFGGRIHERRNLSPCNRTSFGLLLETRREVGRLTPSSPSGHEQPCTANSVLSSDRLG